MASDHSLHKLLDYGTRTFTLFDVRHVHHVSSDDGLDIQPSQSAVVKRLIGALMLLVCLQYIKDLPLVSSFMLTIVSTTVCQRVSI